MPIGKAGSLGIPCAVHLMLHGTDAAAASDWKINKFLEELINKD
jgi:hypothetical protein